MIEVYKMSLTDLESIKEILVSDFDDFGIILFLKMNYLMQILIT